MLINTLNSSQYFYILKEFDTLKRMYYQLAKQRNNPDDDDDTWFDTWLEEMIYNLETECVLRDSNTSAWV